MLVEFLPLVRTFLCCGICSVTCACRTSIFFGGGVGGMQSVERKKSWKREKIHILFVMRCFLLLLLIFICNGSEFWQSQTVMFQNVYVIAQVWIFHVLLLQMCCILVLSYKWIILLYAFILHFWCYFFSTCSWCFATLLRAFLHIFFFRCTFSSFFGGGGGMVVS